MTVAIDELGVDDVREYLHRALEFAPPEDLVEMVWSRAGGHPLLLREVVEAIEPTATPRSRVFARIGAGAAEIGR